MGKFAKSEKQASSVIKALQKNGDIQSLVTAKNYENCLTRACDFAKENKMSLRDIDKETAHDYLNQRATEVSQKTLDQERHALQKMMQKLTGKLEANEKLNPNKADKQQNLTSRTYTGEQVSLVSNAQNKANSLSTEIAHAAGLRSKELLTIGTPKEQPPTPATLERAIPEKFSARPEGVKYTVQGKGGMYREVMLPKDLAERLEKTRLETPKTHKDRGVYYKQRYDISGGQKWANSFSQASKRVLGWSSGAHGLRHSYAQERLNELQSSGVNSATAKEAVSQELGHFDPSKTETYLR